MASQQALAEGLRNPTGSKCGAQISLTRDTSGLLQFLSPAPRVSLTETFLTYKHLDTTNVCLQLLISAPRKSLGCALLHSTQLCWIPPAAMADVETSERAWRGCVDRGGSLTMLWSSFLLGGIWKRPWACLTVKKTLFFSSKEPRDNCDCVQHLQVWMVNSICGCSFRIPSSIPTDGPPLLNAHNPVGCSGIGWLCPPLLISAGTQRKARHAMLVPSSISNLEIAECIYRSLSSNLLNPWSPIPLELSHSATTHNLQKIPFPALASVFLCTGCDF